MPQVNEQAPTFECEDQDGTTIKLSDFKGKNVVLFFYPKDNTPGCTTEAKDFTRLQSEFEKKNTVIFGISKDSIKSHKNFCDKQALGIQLLSDGDGAICESYGVWQEKKNYGKTYMGIVRSTFLINADGIVANAWSSVKVKGHAEAVLETI